MGDQWKEDFHEDGAYGIKLVESQSGLRAALHDEKLKVIAFQSFGETLEPEAYQELIDWVRQGHTLWFYDTRLAGAFGMKAYPLTGEEFRHKPEEGVLGGKKRSGLAAVLLSIGSHPIQTGVGQVTIFIPEQKEKDGDKPSYGAIEVAGDTAGLLQFAVDSPALVACRREGRGLIVFKSLLWNEPLSGDRFQKNLLEFSAGFQVPDLAGVGKVGVPPGPDAEYVEGNPAVPLSVQPAAAVDSSAKPAQESPEKNGKQVEPEGEWSLELQDGTSLQGSLDMKMLEFETASSSLKLPPDQIKELVMGDSVKLDKLTTAAGKEQSGLLMTHPLRFRTARGVEEFEKEDVVRLTHSTSP